MRYTNFIDIDYETATPKRHSACQLGIVVVENGNIVEEKAFLTQPTNN